MSRRQIIEVGKLLLERAATLTSQDSSDRINGMKNYNKNYSPLNRIRSSWNADRVAASCTHKKSTYVRRAHKRSAVKSMKASDLYVKEYGETAYENWKIREERINSLMRSGEYAASQIRELREDNLRRMKEEGAHRNDAHSVHSLGFQVGIAA